MQSFPKPLHWIGWWFDTSKTISLRRNRTRARVVPDHVIINHWLELQKYPPQLNEGFNKLYRFDTNLKSGITKFQTAIRQEVRMKT